MEKDGLTLILEGFKRPDASCTQIPFWFLNGEIDGDEYARQIAEMDKKGVKQAMPHPRFGMDRRDYLSPRYFEQFGKLIRRAKEIGFTLHLYDEYNWASGPAGGRVTAKRENCALGLNMLSKRGAGECAIEFKRPQFEAGFKGWGELEKIIGAAAIPIIDGNADGSKAKWVNFTENEDAVLVQVPQGEHEVAVFCTIRTVHPSPLRMGNGGIIDYVSKEPTAEFIKYTHEQYYSHFKDAFGTVIKSIFYDETAPYGCGRFTWSTSFAAEFIKIKGYDIVGKLPLLFFDGQGAEKVRCDYWEVLTRLFTENHIGQMADWCERHGIALTGHTFEENFRWSLNGDPLAVLRRQHWPGIDSLFGYKPYSGLKAAAAVSHFARKKVFLCEALGVMDGWEASPENMRKAYNQLAVLGVTHIVPHAFFQTIDNPKAECPPSFFEHNPYWRYYDRLADLTARQCFINRHGAHVCDIAVLHPIVSWWGDSKGGRGCDFPWSSSYEDPRAKASREVFERLMDELMGSQLDFDVIDSTALDEAAIEDGHLAIADEKYKVLIIPFMRTIRRSDAEKALRFAESGGIVVFAGEYPGASAEEGCGDSKLDQVVARLKKASYLSKNDTAEYIKASIIPDVEVISGDKRLIDAAHRRAGDTDIYIISHTGDAAASFALKLRAFGNVMILDPETGKCFAALNVEQFSCGVAVTLDMLPCQLLYVLVTREQSKLQFELLPEQKGGSKAVDISGEWLMLPVSESEIGCSVAKTAISVPLFKFIAKGEEDGEESGFWREWFKPSFDDSEWESGHTMRGPALFDHTGSRCFRIPIPAGVAGIKLPLPIEKEYALYINGRLEKVQLYREQQSEGVLPIEKQDCAGLLGVECSSMAPNFGITAPFEFIVKPVKTHARDWCELGYGWYSGWMLYEREISLENPRGVILDLGTVKECAAIYVNGEFAGVRLWRPYVFDITKHLKKGANKISVYVCNLLSNRFSWYPLGTRGGGRQLPSGLLGPVRLIYQ